MKILCIGDSLTAGYISDDLGHAPYSDHLDQMLRLGTSSISSTNCTSSTSCANISGDASTGASSIIGTNTRTNTFVAHITNAGVDGETVSEIEERLKQLLAEDEYVAVVLLGGTNDLGDLGFECSTSSEADVEAAVADISFDGIYRLLEGSKATLLCLQLTVPFNAFDRLDDLEKARKEALNRRIMSTPYPKKVVLDINDPSYGFNYLRMTETERALYFSDSLHYTALGYRRLAECIYNALCPALQILLIRDGGYDMSL
ncbi:hypothetical protein BGZ94_001249 [Podila epigama]|nr:hypothetical protein BGZ94_001249 [Podila epigama]